MLDVGLDEGPNNNQIISDLEREDEDLEGDEDNELMVVCNDKHNHNMIPSSYICIRCKQVGKHYIMNCDQD